MDSINYSGIKQINSYTLESFPNGDLSISRRRDGLGLAIGSLAATAFFVYLAFKIDGYLAMVYGIGMVIFGVMGGVLLFSYLRPDKVYISKNEDRVIIKSSLLRARVPGKEIVCFKYRHIITETRNSIGMTVSTDHWVGVEMVLRNGKSYPFIRLTTNIVFLEDIIKPQAMEIMTAMQTAFKSKIELVA